MKKVLAVLALFSVPFLMMLQVLQAYRYAVTMENADVLQTIQQDRLEENRHLLAGIAVFDAPARVYRVARETLELSPVEPENVIEVVFPANSETEQ